MIITCPHCSYRNGIEEKRVKGSWKRKETGDEDFYKSDFELRRDGGFLHTPCVTLYGCPKCKKTFID